MSWIMIAIISGSIVVSGHDSREACEGRAYSIRDASKYATAAKCVEAPANGLTFSGSTSTIIACGMNGIVCK